VRRLWLASRSVFPGRAGRRNLGRAYVSFDSWLRNSSRSAREVANAAALEKAGAVLELVSLEDGEVQGFNHHDKAG
jgi:hypothetical protein